MFESVCELTVAAVQAADPFALGAALARVSEDQLSAAPSMRPSLSSPRPNGRQRASARQSVAVTRYTEHVLARTDEERAAR